MDGEVSEVDGWRSVRWDGWRSVRWMDGGGGMGTMKPWLILHVVVTKHDYLIKFTFQLECHCWRCLAAGGEQGRSLNTETSHH